MMNAIFKFYALAAMLILYRNGIEVIIGVARIFDWGGPIPVADQENFGGGGILSTNPQKFGCLHRN